VGVIVLIAGNPLKIGKQSVYFVGKKEKTIDF